LGGQKKKEFLMQYKRKKKEKKYLQDKGINTKSSS